MKKLIIFSLVLLAGCDLFQKDGPLSYKQLV